MFSVKVSSAETGIQLITKSLQSLDCGQQLNLTLKTNKTHFNTHFQKATFHLNLSAVGSDVYLVTTNGEKNILFREFEASADHGFKIRLVSVLPKAGHLSSAGHLHT